ncbi:type VI secretion system baseplate subunit TssF [Pseudomonas aeruginosa]
MAGKPMSFRLTGERVQPVGFAEDEALIPLSLNTFRGGYRYLQEYFAFQDKFLVRSTWMTWTERRAARRKPSSRSAASSCASTITQERHPAPAPDAGNVKLYCTPVANLSRRL